MKNLLVIVLGFFCVFYFVGSIKEIRNEKVWIQEYNKIYANKNPDKVALINEYYDCLSSSKSVIEGCDVHVAKGKVDITVIHSYINGLDQYVYKKKKDD